MRERGVCFERERGQGREGEGENGSGFDLMQLNCESKRPVLIEERHR